MNTEIDKYERIQEYLLGRMTDDDRVAFERDLASDDSLREQYEDLRLLVRSIKKANQEVDLRIALEESEKQLAESSMTVQDEAAINEELSRVEQELKMMGVSVEDPKPNVFQVLKDRINNAFRSVGQWFAMRGPWTVEITGRNTPSIILSRISGVAVRLAVVCSFAVACTMGTLGYNAHSVGMGYQIAYDASKGADPITEKVLNGDYSEAQVELSELVDYKKQQREGLSPDSDQFQYYSSEIDEMEFLDAVCDLRRWKYFSAKSKLKAIASREGYYQSQAKELLDKLL